MILFQQYVKCSSIHFKNENLGSDSCPVEGGTTGGGGPFYLWKVGTFQFESLIWHLPQTVLSVSFPSVFIYDDYRGHHADTHADAGGL